MKGRGRARCLDFSFLPIFLKEGFKDDFGYEAANNVMSDKKVVDLLIIF